jgi:hypothetical protein
MPDTIHAEKPAFIKKHLTTKMGGCTMNSSKRFDKLDDGGDWSYALTAAALLFIASGTPHLFAPR